MRISVIRCCFETLRKRTLITIRRHELSRPTRRTCATVTLSCVSDEESPNGKNSWGSRRPIEDWFLKLTPRRAESEPAGEAPRRPPPLPLFPTPLLESGELRAIRAWFKIIIIMHSTEKTGIIFLEEVLLLHRSAQANLSFPRWIRNVSASQGCKIVLKIYFFLRIRLQFLRKILRAIRGKINEIFYEKYLIVST